MTAFRPSVSRSRVVVQMSPPATEVVDTTPWPISDSARAAVPAIRAMGPTLAIGSVLDDVFVSTGCRGCRSLHSRGEVNDQVVHGAFDHGQDESKSI